MIPTESTLHIADNCNIIPNTRTLCYLNGDDDNNTWYEQIPDKKALFNGDKYIATMSNASADNLRTYPDFVNMLNTGLMESNSLDLDNVEVQDDMLDNGGKFSRLITFHGTTTTFGKDTMKLRMWAWTAYNLRWAEQFIFGPMIVYCLNGCMRADWKIKGMSKKNWNTKTSLSASDISRALDAFNQYPEWFELMAKRTVLQDNVKHLFENTLAAIDDPLHPRVSSYAMSELSTHWDSYKRRYGLNMYAVYQTATHWATHPEGKGQPMNKFRTRSDKVASMLQSQDWNTLLAA
jgi:hypothetical protein